MIKKIIIIAVVVVAGYFVLQIPSVSEYVDEVKTNIMEKKDNVANEYERVKGKVDETVEKVGEVKKGIDETVDTVNETAEKMSEISEKVTELFSGVEGEVDEDMIEICTEEEKAAEICTMDYSPVCGDDGATYSNACVGCSSGNIDYYIPGEC